MKPKCGEVDNAKIIKAGCGTRYDPEQLGDHSGFDFSAAPQLKQCAAEPFNLEVSGGSIEEPNRLDKRNNPKA